MRSLAILMFTGVLLVIVNIDHVQSKRMQTIDEVRKLMKGLRKSCASKVGASAELLDAAANAGEFPPDPKLQCYFKCMMLMTKSIKNDQIQGESMKKQADIMLPVDLVERFKGIIDKCLPEATSEEICEAAWQFTKCLYNADPEVYFIP